MLFDIFTLDELHWFKYFQLFKEANFENHFPEVQMEWSRIASLMCQIFDPTSPQSLTNICFDPDRYTRQSLAKQPIKVPIELIMNEDSIRLIQEDRLFDLPLLYQNLLTDKDQQKRALVQERMILL